MRAITVIATTLVGSTRVHPRPQTRTKLVSTGTTAFPLTSPFSPSACQPKKMRNPTLGVIEAIKAQKHKKTHSVLDGVEEFAERDLHEPLVSHRQSDDGGEEGRGGARRGSRSCAPARTWPRRLTALIAPPDHRNAHDRRAGPLISGRRVPLQEFRGDARSPYAWDWLEWVALTSRKYKLQQISGGACFINCTFEGGSRLWPCSVLFSKRWNFLLTRLLHLQMADCINRKRYFFGFITSNLHFYLRDLKYNLMMNIN